MLTKQIIPRLDLEKILANFSLGKIISKKALATSGNITCILNTSTGIYFLRLCPNGQRWRSQAEGAGERELLNYLKSRNLPVIEALPT
ncbi:MAG: hypothetical protein NTX66_03570, partial [Candidatus Falkowbacteria bacterium]|nr:hypothetical protein [Candidatus Falkowbacteria bacterium]